MLHVKYQMGKLFNVCWLSADRWMLWTSKKPQSVNCNKMKHSALSPMIMNLDYKWNSVKSECLLSRKLYQAGNTQACISYEKLFGASRCWKYSGWSCSVERKKLECVFFTVWARPLYN